MKMAISKRGRIEIYEDILVSIRSESENSKKASPTRVAQQANLPYDRLQKLLINLVKSGLVSQMNDGFILTDKGVDCLNQIQRNHDFLRRMGLL
jgi:predicted transcriptional regulator